MLTSFTLANLNGLLALEASNRARAGDGRDKSEIVDDILREAEAPALDFVVDTIAMMVKRGYSRAVE